MLNMIYFLVFPMVSDPDTLSSTHKGRVDHSFRMFSYRDIERATRNFSSHMLLGSGHYGEVYRGWLDKRTFSPSTSDNGLIIAVKRLYTYKFKPHMVKEVNMIPSKLTDAFVFDLQNAYFDCFIFSSIQFTHFAKRYATQLFIH
ncbi:putative non-specific serine/threonine protein kinase [Helianthus anomalus]